MVEPVPAADQFYFAVPAQPSAGALAFREWIFDELTADARVGSPIPIL
jgi:hypothetical protein